MEPISLKDRFEAKRPKPRRQPEWIRRMQEGKLPNKDLTGKGPDAA